MVYQQFASLYDQLMEHAPYDRWVDLTREVFQRCAEPVHQVLDLGCGTGEITTRLAKLGYDMIGVDYSSEMLALAEQKALSQQLSIQWIKQDIRELEGFSQFDAAISYCDVINYITELKDVERVFQRVAQCLKPQGLFIFDVHACEYVSNKLIGHTFADIDEEVVYIWQCFAGDEPYEMYHDMTFFTKAADGKYLRFSEHHHQRTYPVKIYVNLLEKAGFQNIRISADFNVKNHHIHEDSERIFFFAEKGSRTS